MPIFWKWEMGIFFSIIDSETYDNSREQSRVERAGSHVQNIKTRRLGMM